MDIPLENGKYKNQAMKEPLHVSDEGIDDNQHVSILAKVLDLKTADARTGLSKKRTCEKLENSPTCFLEIEKDQDVRLSKKREAKRARDNSSPTICVGSLIEGEPATLPSDCNALRTDSQSSNYVRSTVRDVDERNRRIASILAQAASVGQAVEEIHKSKVSSAVPGSNICSTFRHRPQRRNSFVIHKNQLGISGIPLVMSSRSISASAIYIECGAPGSICINPNVLESDKVDDGSQLGTRVGLSMKRQEIDINEDQVQPSLLSIWSNSYNRTRKLPVLTEEAKDFYGYE